MPDARVVRTYQCPINGCGKPIECYCPDSRIGNMRAVLEHFESDHDMTQASAIARAADLDGYTSHRVAG